MIKNNRDLFSIIVSFIEIVIGILICTSINDYKYPLLVTISVCCIFWSIFLLFDMRNCGNNKFSRWLDKPLKKKK